MTIPTLIGLMILYAVLRRAVSNTRTGSVYGHRLSRREEIRARHARYRRNRARQERKIDNKETKKDAISSDCA